MEEDDEFEALDPQRHTKKSSLNALGATGATMSDIANSEDEMITTGGDRHKLTKPDQTSALHYRDDTLYAVSGTKKQNLAQTSSLKKRGTAVVSDLGSATKDPKSASSAKKAQQQDL